MLQKHALLASALAVSLHSHAHAYVGPGVGLALLGPFFTLLVLIGVALLTLLYFPLRRIYRRWRRRDQRKAG